MRNVIILTDFTSDCFWSVIYGLDFCRYYGVTPEILHVEIPGADGFVDALERKKVTNTVDLYNTRFKIGAKVVIRSGGLQEVVASEARANNAQLIILCTRGKQGFQSITGSAAAKIIFSLNIPIIVMQNRRFSPLRKALLPINYDSVCPDCLARYAELSKTISMNVEVVGREDTMEICQRVSHMFDGSKVSVIERSEKRFSFIRQVINYSEKNNADLILALPPEGSSQHLFMGSMEELLFNIPQIPVLCP